MMDEKQVAGENKTPGSHGKKPGIVYKREKTSLVKTKNFRKK
jgi:hypothetical protein